MNCQRHLGYLAFNQVDQTAFIPNEEIRKELKIATESTKWNELITFQRESERLLNATLNLDEKAVAAGIEKIHMDYVSSLQYNNENSLSSVLAIAYLSAVQYYFKPVRELKCPAGILDKSYMARWQAFFTLFPPFPRPLKNSSKT